MNVTSRELAMAFLEGRSFELGNSVVTPTEYRLNNYSIAKWEKTKLFIRSPGLTKANHKVYLNRVNSILDGYDCGIVLQEQRRTLYFVEDLTEIKIEVVPGRWYYIDKHLGVIAEH